MVHARTRASCLEAVGRIARAAEAAGAGEHRVLFGTVEFKKESPRYY
jgi:hypothetical protein